MASGARMQISLYDALVSINVPGEKARAVLDAMEQELSSELATKADLQQLEERMQLRFDLLRKELDAVRNELNQRIDLLNVSMTVRLGSIMVVGLGVLFAALKLT